VLDNGRTLIIAMHLKSHAYVMAVAFEVWRVARYTRLRNHMSLRYFQNVNHLTHLSSRFSLCLTVVPEYIGDLSLLVGRKLDLGTIQVTGL
jgi:hypothetical protein